MQTAQYRFQARKAFVESQATLMGGTRANNYSAFVFADEETTEAFYQALSDYDDAATDKLRTERRVASQSAVQALRDECKPRNTNVGNRVYYEVDVSVWGTIKAVVGALFFIALFCGVVSAVGYVIYDRIENGPPISIKYVGDCENG